MTIVNLARKNRRTKHLRAFTLVELMVALTGGLFISVIVFAMARQGTRFYQQESRMAEATLAATIGMQRLRADIGRAGYMASPFINSDPNLCTNLATLNVAPLLQNLRSIQISSDATIAANPDLQGGAAAPIVPDRIQLSGAYQNADRFIAGYMPPNPGVGNANISIPLQPNIGALVRYRYGAVGTNNAALLDSLFPTGRALRLVNQYGRVAYGIIGSTTTTGGPNGALPAINMLAAPQIPLRGAATNICQFAGVGVEVNVVNFYLYRIADVQHSPTYSPLFGQLYASTANPWNANRTELIREELDPVTGVPFVQTDANGVAQALAPEIIAEYAVELEIRGDVWVSLAKPDSIDHNGAECGTNGLCRGRNRGQ